MIDRTADAQRPTIENAQTSSQTDCTRDSVFLRNRAYRKGAVEESCRKSGLERVTVEELERIRSRMPTPKIFG